MKTQLFWLAWSLGVVVGAVEVMTAPHDGASEWVD